MVVRSAAVVFTLALLGASPALAQSTIDPAAVLAAKTGHGFAGRTARITSIMGSDLSTAAPLHVPTRQGRIHPVRREADALAGAR